MNKNFVLWQQERRACRARFLIDGAHGLDLKGQIENLLALA
jgi:hypothetical protein